MSINSQAKVTGPILWGISIGLQCLIAIMFGWGSSPLPFALLNDYARKIARPEQETHFYLAGIVGTLVCAYVAVTLWQRGIQQQPLPDRSTFGACMALGLSIAALSGMVFLLLLATNHIPWLYIVGGPHTPLDHTESLRLFVPTTLTVLSGLLCLQPPTLQRFRPWLSAVGRPLWQRPPAATCEPPPAAGTRGTAYWPELVMAVSLLVLLFVPWRSATILAGQLYHAELLHHWNYFAMGPTIAWQAGMALGTEAYSQYGVGWPLLFAAVSPWLPRSYGGMIVVASLYSAIYYTGMFLLLRRLLHHALWATAGTMLALYWELGCGTTMLGPWQCPSSTPLRHPLDVWFFLALLAFLRDGRHRWILLAGAALGLAIACETDTGLYLVPIFLFSTLFPPATAHASGRCLSVRAWSKTILLGGLSAALLLLPILGVASRGTLATSKFWTGWLEGLHSYAKLGIGSIPLTDVPDGTLLCFLLILTVYLLILCHLIIQRLHNRTPPAPEEVLLGCIAGYGLLTLLVFVNRSHAWNIYHPLAAFAILLTVLAQRASARLSGFAKNPGVPAALLLLVPLAMLGSSSLQTYPNLIRAQITPPATPPHASLAYTPLPPDLTELCLQLTTNKHDPHRLAVVTDDDTVIYAMTGLRPWMRYTPPEPLFFHPSGTPRLLQLLAEQQPELIILRDGQSWPDVTAACRRQLAADYRLQGRVGRYETWHRARPPNP